MDKHQSSYSGFLKNAHKDRAGSLLNALVNSTELVRGDKLVVQCANSKGSIARHSPKICTLDNALWGIYLQAINKKAAANDVLESMKDVGLTLPHLTRNNGLIGWYLNIDEGWGWGDPTLHSLDNSVWGIFLQKIGKKEEAHKVYHAMKKTKIAREDGLVIKFGNAAADSIWNIGIYPRDNFVWGMFLYEIGKKEEAHKLYNTLKSTGMIYNTLRNTGVIIQNGKIKRTSAKTDPIDSLLLGMFLQKLGKKEEAYQLYHTLKNTGTIGKDGIIERAYTKADRLRDSALQKIFPQETGKKEVHKKTNTRIEPIDNLLLGIFLKKMGVKEEAHKIYPTLKSAGVIREDGIIRKTDKSIYALDNALLGIYLAMPDSQETI